MHVDGDWSRGDSPKKTSARVDGSGLEAIWSSYRCAELHIWTPAIWAVGPYLYKAWQVTGLQNLLGNQGWVPGRGS